MLHATFLNINKDNIEMTVIAMEAINRIMPSIGQAFAVKDQRDYIMSGLINAGNFSDDDIQELAIQALIVSVDLGYDNMDEYINDIGMLSMKLLAGQNMQTMRSMLLFWTALCEADIKKMNDGTSKNYASLGVDAMFDIVSNGLNITELEDDERDLAQTTDEEKWTVMRAAATLLQKIA